MHACTACSMTGDYVVDEDHECYPKQEKRQQRANADYIKANLSITHVSLSVPMCIRLFQTISSKSLVTQIHLDIQANVRGALAEALGIEPRPPRTGTSHKKP